MQNNNGKNLEALTWLQQHPGNSLGNQFTNTGAIEFIEQIYHTGADSVIAFNISLDDQQIERAAHLIIMLPDDMSKRGALFRWYNRLVRARGWVTIDDREQDFLCLMF